MNDKKILLAEDNPNDIELTLAALAGQNLTNEVVVVRDGIEVMDYLRRQGKFSTRTDNSPLVVLLDLKMPLMDGLQVLREMKADPVLKKIPVVVLTSSREEKDLVESYGLGVNGYVVKPVGFDQFLEAIKRIGLFWILTNESPPETGGVPRQPIRKQHGLEKPVF